MSRLAARKIAAALVACVGCASANGRRGAQSEIMRLDAEWSRAAQERDLDRVVSFWADDAVV